MIANEKTLHKRPNEVEVYNYRSPMNILKIFYCYNYFCFIDMIFFIYVAKIIQVGVACIKQLKNKIFPIFASFIFYLSIFK